MAMSHPSLDPISGEAPVTELQPTCRCIILTTKDALLLVQQCINGALSPINRRPHDRERADLVRPGNVFIYTEAESGIKRWTDGVNWSPSRILGNFLVYRELDKAFPPGEKKKAAKRAKRYTAYERNPAAPNPDRAHNGDIYVTGARRMLSRDEERLLVGSLNESYCFKQDGLIKRTISLTHRGSTYHLVWYISFYTFIEGNLPRPEQSWPDVIISPDFLQEQNLRCPLNPDGTETHAAIRDRLSPQSQTSPGHSSMLSTPLPPMESFQFAKFPSFPHAPHGQLFTPVPNANGNYQAENSHLIARGNSQPSFNTRIEPQGAFGGPMNQGSFPRTNHSNVVYPSPPRSTTPAYLNQPQAQNFHQGGVDYSRMGGYRALLVDQSMMGDQGRETMNAPGARFSPQQQQFFSQGLPRPGMLQPLQPTFPMAPGLQQPPAMAIPDHFRDFQQQQLRGGPPVHHPADFGNIQDKQQPKQHEE